MGAVGLTGGSGKKGSRNGKSDPSLLEQTWPAPGRGSAASSAAVAAMSSPRSPYFLLFQSFQELALIPQGPSSLQKICSFWRSVSFKGKTLSPGSLFSVPSLRTFLVHSQKRIFGKLLVSIS